MVSNDLFGKVTCSMDRPRGERLSSYSYSSQLDFGAERLASNKFMLAILIGSLKHFLQYPNLSPTYQQSIPAPHQHHPGFRPQRKDIYRALSLSPFRTTISTSVSVPLIIKPKKKKLTSTDTTSSTLLGIHAKY